MSKDIKTKKASDYSEAFVPGAGLEPARTLRFTGF